MNPKISIIIPTYQPGNYFKDCLDSIAKQTFNSTLFELIIILNGTKEYFFSQIVNYTKEFKCMVYILYTDVAGASNARNIGLDNANGKNIVFIDDDDIISENYIEELCENLSENSIVVSNFMTFSNDTNTIPGDYLNRCFLKNISNKRKNLLKIRSHFSTACGKIIPISIIQNRRFNLNYNIGEDALFMAEISDKIKQIKMTSENAFYYRRLRQNSASRKRKNYIYRTSNNVRLFTEYFKMYLKNPLRYNLAFFATRLMAVIRNQFFIFASKKMKIDQNML